MELLTAVSLVLLAALSFPYWKQLGPAGVKPLALIAVGGGVLAGGLGIVFLYAGLKHGDLSTVMTVAFCLAPVLGTVLGFVVLKERLTALQLLGIGLCVAGAALAVLGGRTVAG